MRNRIKREKNERVRNALVVGSKVKIPKGL